MCAWVRGCVGALGACSLCVFYVRAYVQSPHAAAHLCGASCDLEPWSRRMLGSTICPWAAPRAPHIRSGTTRSRSCRCRTQPSRQKTHAAEQRDGRSARQVSGNRAGKVNRKANHDMAALLVASARPLLHLTHAVGRFVWVDRHVRHALPPRSWSEGGRPCVCAWGVCACVRVRVRVRVRVCVCVCARARGRAGGRAGMV